MGFVIITHKRFTMKLKFLFTIGLLSIGIAQAQEFAKGVVFHDTNKNGKKDKSEVGLKSVSVSNGKDVVQTNEKGEYRLPVGSDNIIFVIKPSDYSFPLNENNLPQYYYIHKPNGSPVLKYSVSLPTGKLPARLDFPMYRQDESKQFQALVFGDPQVYNLEELAFFKKGIINDLNNGDSIAFGISLGDLVGDNLDLHAPYKDVIKQIGKPWYNVMGNHDMNYDVLSDSLSDESFEKNFGPNNYSFNYGDAHFIVLDNIIYPNPRTGKGYLGGFRKDQLDFIENDLKFVPKDKLIVLCFHIPLKHNNSDVFRNEDRQRLFDLLAEFNHTVSMSAHTHYQQQLFYDKSEGWRQEKPHHEYNVGTTSGDWYSGLDNNQGVPQSMMRDGTPKGYAILNVKGNQYSFDYKVAGENQDYQINIIAPKAVSKKHLGRYKLYANFFMGTANDKVKFRIDGGKWNDMKHVEIVDLAYQYEVLKFDNAIEFMDGRRPSNPVKSSHIWEIKFPNNLSQGVHNIEVEATDMFGKTHKQNTTINVM